MKEELDNALCEKYPLLYRHRWDSPRATCMCWGFTCGDGWYKLIDELSAKLEAKIVKLKEDGVPLEKLPVAAQVKEKFGGLRFYMDYATEDMYDLTGEAENRSYSICEFCGDKGKTRNRSWVRTLCDRCNSQ